MSSEPETAENAEKADPVAEARRYHRRRALKYLVVFLVPVVAAGAWAFWSGDRVAVAAPQVTGTTAQECSALHRALPRTLLGREARSTSPSASNVAAWGDPAMVLRCGVAVPAVLDPGNRAYDPTTQAEDINGLCWVDRPASDGGVVFTTVKQDAYVELSVPKAYMTGNSPLPELTSAVERTDPSAPDRVFDCS